MVVTAPLFSNPELGTVIFGEIHSDSILVDAYLRPYRSELAAAEAILSYDSQAKILFFSNLDVNKYRGRAERTGALGIVPKQKIKEVLQAIETAETRA